MKRLAEQIKTLIIALLVFSMLFLWGKNMQLRFPSGNQAVESHPVLDSDFWIFTDSTTPHTDITVDKKYFSPIAITLITNSVARTSATNSTLTSRLWSGIDELVLEVFSSAYECKGSGLNEWNEVLLKSDFILVDFPSSLPYMTLCALENKTSEFASGELCSIKTLALYPDENNVLSALSIDSEQNVYAFRPIKDASAMIYDFNSNNLTAYTVNKGFIPSTLAINTSFEALPKHHAVMTSAPTLETITVSNPIASLFYEPSYADGMSNSSLISHPTVTGLLDVFEINPATVGVYTDASARLVFINSDTRLVIDPSGSVEYAISRDGTPQILTSSLLESDRTQFSSFEQVNAATHFLNLLKGTFIGEKTELILDTVSRTSGKTEYVFSYFNQLCRISCTQSEASVRLVFDDMGLVEATITPLSVSLSTESTNDRHSVVASVTESVAIILSSIDKAGLPIDDFRPVYICETYDTPTPPVWATVTERT